MTEKNFSYFVNILNSRYTDILTGLEASDSFDSDSFDFVEWVSTDFYTVVDDAWLNCDLECFERENLRVIAETYIANYNNRFHVYTYVSDIKAVYLDAINGKAELKVEIERIKDSIERAWSYEDIDNLETDMLYDLCERALFNYRTHTYSTEAFNDGRDIYHEVIDSLVTAYSYADTKETFLNRVNATADSRIANVVSEFVHDLGALLSRGV